MIRLKNKIFSAKFLLGAIITITLAISAPVFENATFIQQSSLDLTWILKKQFLLVKKTLACLGRNVSPKMNDSFLKEEILAYQHFGRYFTMGGDLDLKKADVFFYKLKEIENNFSLTLNKKECPHLGHLKKNSLYFEKYKNYYKEAISQRRHIKRNPIYRLIYPSLPH